MQKEITPYQAFTIVHSTIFGIGILSLPRDLAKSSGVDGMYVLLLAGFLVWITLFFVTKLTQRFPGQRLGEYLLYLLGSKQKKWIGHVISIPFFILLGGFWLVAIAAMMRLCGEGVGVPLLPHTPLSVIMLLPLVISAIATGSSLNLIARFNELLFPLVFLPIMLFLFGMFSYGHLENLLPLFQIDWKDLFWGVLTTTFAFSGYDVILAFSGFYQKPEQSLKVHTAALISITAIYWFAFVSSVSVFGVDEIKYITWPITEYVKLIANPHFLIQALEPVILSIWIVFVFVSMTNTYVALVQMVKGYVRINEKKAKWIPWLFAPFIYGLALYPHNVQEMFHYAQWIGGISFILMATLPVVLLVIAFIRKKRGREDRNEESNSSAEAESSIGM
jgi:spore germination protein